jgi:MoxR-like ATPase
MIESLKKLQRNLVSVIQGSEVSSTLLMVGVLAKGHILIQDAPGLGKTTLVKSLAQSIDCKFRRIQFTPDLLPSDILGYSMYNQGKESFVFIEGPIFSNIVLADEINRTSPRIQSALLEAMNEQQVTVDGEARKLREFFVVIATQNNLYSTGTFPLPEPQLDRFLMSFKMGMPSISVQSSILLSHAVKTPLENIEKVMSVEDLMKMQKEVEQVHVHQNIADYIIELSENTRRNEKIIAGVSVRGSIALMKASQSLAYIQGRDLVHPDDVKKVIFPVFNHRLSLKNIQGKKSIGASSVIEEILNAVRVP